MLLEQSVPTRLTNVTATVTPRETPSCALTMSGYLRRRSVRLLAHSTLVFDRYFCRSHSAKSAAGFTWSATQPQPHFACNLRGGLVTPMRSPSETYEPRSLSLPPSLPPSLSLSLNFSIPQHTQLQLADSRRTGKPFLERAPSDRLIRTHWCPETSVVNLIGTCTEGSKDEAHNTRHVHRRRKDNANFHTQLRQQWQRKA